MAIYQKDVDFAKGMLWQGEKVLVTATQRRVGPGMAPVNPTTVIATDQRIIIINRATFGFRKDVETIPYSRISSVRLENGFISSSVFLRVGGYSSPGERGFLKPGEQEGELDGLSHEDAKALSELVDKIITSFKVPGMQQAVAQQNQNTSTSQKKNGQAAQNPAPPPTTGGFFYCQKCGSKNDAGAQFCEMCGTKLGK